MTGVSRTPSGRPSARSISPTQLRSMWRSASQERGWSYPDDWWCPAVDAVTEAIITDGDVAERCRRLGLARVRAGVSMAETLDDVVALARLARALQSHPAHSFATPPHPIDVVVLLESAAVGWADGVEGGGGLGGAGISGAQDAGHGGSGHGSSGGRLPGAGYLTERLREAAAEAESAGERLGDRYGLVVAALLGPTGKSRDPLDVQARLEAWDRTWQMSQLGDDLHAVFCAGESIVRTGPSTATVLARRTPQLATRVGSLRSLIKSRTSQDSPEPRDLPGSSGSRDQRDQRDRRDSSGSPAARDAGPGVRIWLERLPDNVQQAIQLLTDLRR